MFDERCFYLASHFLPSTGFYIGWPFFVMKQRSTRHRQAIFVTKQRSTQHRQALFVTNKHLPDITSGPFCGEQIFT
jgi:hypothetical protein